MFRVKVPYYNRFDSRQLPDQQRCHICDSFKDFFLLAWEFYEHHIEIYLLSVAATSWSYCKCSIRFNQKESRYFITVRFVDELVRNVSRKTLLTNKLCLHLQNILKGYSNTEGSDRMVYVREIHINLCPQTCEKM